MAFQFTPAGQRVLDAARRWRVGDSEVETGPVELLLGLLDEPEYRAAGILARRGIDQTAVQSRWPTARRVADPALSGRRHPELANVVDQALQQVLARLDSGRGFPLATEHLLLGLARAEHEVAAWLAAWKLEATDLEADICARYGLSFGPLSLDPDDRPIPLAEAVSPDSKIVFTDALDNMAAEATAPELSDGESERASVRNMTEAPPMTAACRDASDETALIRIIDAAANRAGEAVRVVEDYVRFALDDALLTETCKALRHELKRTLSLLPAAERLSARDTPGDVGTSLTTESERTRSSLFDVAAANVRRLQESLRSLEEFGKLLDSDFAAACERLRYSAYTLHQMIGRGVESRRRLSGARLYVLIDGRDSPEAFESLATAVLDGGAQIVQLRDKRLDDRTLLERARRLRVLTREAGALFIMNDRPDLAVASDADGVHVGQEELPVGDVRRIVGPRRLIGVSTHSIEQLRKAVLDGADYLGVGPTFPSGTKQFEQYPGLDFVRAAVRETTLPAFAIGGITLENLRSVVEAGLSRVAVAGAVAGAADPKGAAGEFRRRLNKPGA